MCVCLFFLLFSPCFFPLQYDFMERLDGKEKWSVVESPRERRSIQTLVQNEAVFVQYLDVGLWHLAFYNDGKDKEVISFSTVILGRYLQVEHFSSLFVPSLTESCKMLLQSSVFSLFILMLCFSISQCYSVTKSVMGC